MRRRTVLASTGAVFAALAGCLDSDSSSPGESPAEDGNRTDEENSPTDSTDDSDLAALDLAVTDVQLRTLYLYPTHPDAADVTSTGSDQFVFLAVETDSAVTRRDFSLVLEGEATDAADRLGDDILYSLNRGWMADPELPTTPYDEGEGLIGFSVPRDIDPVESATLVAETEKKRGEWSLPVETVEQLHTPPEFEASLSLPDELVWEADFEAEMSVTNAGGRAGIFVAIFGVESATHPAIISTTIPAEETVAKTVDSSLPDPLEGGPVERPDSVTYTLEWGAGVVEETARVVEN